MFKKMKLNNEIKKLKQLIVDLENKRSRSQAALVSAILEHKEPSENDVDFFNEYTQKIDETRSLLITKEKELEQLK